ncbi:hypothetical protein NDU88_000763 [Pleurodeles waltl]|uniref:Uncharacterized protein n=1 Tax=Pleurodeles waltl TaxID=8319 RepID=A0AAV7P4U5_PLEWA|nr:hypothetical protein NDU88_000763 [Pleurodeles waltl]
METVENGARDPYCRSECRLLRRYPAGARAASALRRSCAWGAFGAGGVVGRLLILSRDPRAGYILGQGVTVPNRNQHKGTDSFDCMKEEWA